MLVALFHIRGGGRTKPQSKLAVLGFADSRLRGPNLPSTEHSRLVGRPSEGVEGRQG
jgi:hypothetical protein